jgi:hypothetical protein
MLCFSFSHLVHLLIKSQLGMRDGTNIVPPMFFLRKYYCNNNEIYVDESYNFCSYVAIFPQSLLNLQHTFASVE